MTLIEAVVCAGGSYLVGCVPAAYYLVRLLSGRDIRELGSGNAGATNAGRVLGSGGFLGVLAFDMAKGGAVVAVARGIGLGPAGAAIAMVAVVAGHVWPLQLALRGGKGVATGVGAALVLDPVVSLLAAGGFLPLYVATGRHRISGLGAIAVSPALAIFLDRSVAVALALGGVASIVLVAHARGRRPAVAFPPDHRSTTESGP